MKKIKYVLIGIICFFIYGFIILDSTRSAVAIILLLAVLAHYCGVLTSPNPFNRKLFSTDNHKHYSVSCYLGAHITLKKGAQNDDLTLAYCECISDSAFSRYSPNIDVSSDGGTYVNSDEAFLPFQMKSAIISFARLHPYSNTFSCGSFPCSLIEPPANISILYLDCCYVETIRIVGESIPELFAESSKVYVPENFSVIVPRELNESALSNPSWSSVQFIGPNKETIDPFRDIRKTHKTSSSCPYIYHCDE